MILPLDVHANEEISNCSVILTGALRKQLRLLALQMSCSQSEIVRNALRAYIDKNNERSAR